MPRNARGKLSLMWHRLHAHRYTVGWSKRPVREMLWVRGLQWQQKILPLLPTCQCVRTMSYLDSEIILTTMRDQVAFKTLPPVQAMTKLQGFLEFWLPWHQPSNIRKSEGHKQRQLDTYRGRVLRHMNMEIWCIMHTLNFFPFFLQETGLSQIACDNK